MCMLFVPTDMENPPPTEVPPVIEGATGTQFPPLPECNEEFVNVYHGNFSSPGYPSGYPHNKNCVYRIVVPEGTQLNVTIVDLHMEWSP